MGYCKKHKHLEGAPVYPACHACEIPELYELENQCITMARIIIKFRDMFNSSAAESDAEIEFTKNLTMDNCFGEQ